MEEKEVKKPSTKKSTTKKTTTKPEKAKSVGTVSYTHLTLPTIA